MRVELPGLWQRIQEAFNNKNPSQIAEQLGISKQSVYKWRDGEVPWLDTLIKISKLTNTSLDWIIFGKQPKGEKFIPVYLEQHLEEKLHELASEENEKVEDEAAKLIIEAMIARGVITDKVEGLQLQFFGDYEVGLVPIPLLGTIAAGRPIQVFDTAETVLVAEEFIIPDRKTFALRVQGDSMIEEGILDRDLIIVMETAEAHPGQTVVALIDGDQATVKKFYRRGRHIVLRPANPFHKDLVLAPERVQIRGVVIGIQRRT